MRIVDAPHPNRRPTPPDLSRFVEKDRQAHGLELRHHLDKIVIPEDTPALRS